MKALVISKSKFERLKPYVLDKAVANSEGSLFTIEYGKNWDNRQKLLKKLYIDEGEYFGNKLLTVNTLIDHHEEIEHMPMVIPERIGVVNNQVSAIIFPFIEDSVNLLMVLRNYKVPMEVKVNLLKQVGTLIEGMRHVNVLDQPIYLGDLHEGNFILDKNGVVKAVDLDSCKIGYNAPFPSRYLRMANAQLRKLPNKYPMIEDRTASLLPGDTQKPYINEINYNTELFCYNMMVMNTLANGPINEYDDETFYTYLQYAKSKGLSDDLMDCFSRLYVNAANQSPLRILDQIPKNNGPYLYNVFENLYQNSSGKNKVKK